MMAVRSPTKLGKQLGKQIQDAIGIWGSTPTQRNDKLSRGLALSLEAAASRTFEFLHMLSRLTDRRGAEIGRRQHQQPLYRRILAVGWPRRA